MTKLSNPLFIQSSGMESWTLARCFSPLVSLSVARVANTLGAVPLHTRFLCVGCRTYMTHRTYANPYLPMSPCFLDVDRVPPAVRLLCARRGVLPRLWAPGSLSLCGGAGLCPLHRATSRTLRKTTTAAALDPTRVMSCTLDAVVGWAGLGGCWIRTRGHCRNSADAACPDTFAVP